MDDTKNEKIIDDSMSFCMLPVFGPALQNIEFVIEYVKRVVSNQALKIDLFDDVYKLISNPALLTDDEIWPIIQEIIEDYDCAEADSFNNQLWNIFKNSDRESRVVRKLTGFMLREHGTQIMKRMIRSSGLTIFTFVPSQAAVLLQKLLSWVFVPVLIPIKKAKVHPTFHPVGIQLVHDIKASPMVLPGRNAFKIWTIRKEWKAFAMNEISTVLQYTLFWDYFQNFVQFAAHCAQENIKLLSMDGEEASSTRLSLQESINDILSEHSFQSLHHNQSVSKVGESVNPNQTDTLESLLESVSLDSTDESYDGSQHSDESYYRLYHPNSNKST